MYHISRKIKILFIFSDILAMITAIFTFEMLSKFSIFKNTYFVILLICFTFLVNIFTEEYRYIENRGYLKELKYSIVYSFNILVVFSFLMILLKAYYYGVLAEITMYHYVILFMLGFGFTYAFRIISKHLIKNFNFMTKDNIIIFKSVLTFNSIEASLEKNYNVIAYVNFDKTQTLYNDKPVLNNFDDIKSFITKNKIDEIYIDYENNGSFDKISNFITELGVITNISIAQISKYYQGNTAIKSVDNHLFMTSAIKIITLRQIILKRTMDIIGAIIGILLTLIVAIIIYPKIQKEAKGPIIFSQTRVGKNGKIFKIYKFRSMYMDAEDKKKDLLDSNRLNTNLIFKMKNDPRVFPFGQKLRDWSIDEMPQFFNVLKGDMSLVGTRPPTLEEYKNYEIRHFKRLQTKPGITGLWQVSGRSNIENFEEIVSLDLQYLQNWSLMLDIKILFKTILTVLKKEGSM